MTGSPFLHLRRFACLCIAVAASAGCDQAPDECAFDSNCPDATPAADTGAPAPESGAADTGAPEASLANVADSAVANGNAAADTSVVANAGDATADIASEADPADAAPHASGAADVVAESPALATTIADAAAEADVTVANAGGEAASAADSASVDAVVVDTVGEAEAEATALPPAPPQPFELAPIAFTGLIFSDGTAVYGTAGGFAVAISTGNGSSLATGTTPIVGLLAQSASNLYALATPPDLPQGTTGQELVIIPKATLQGGSVVPAATSPIYATINGAAATSSSLCFLFSQSSSVDLYSANLDGSNVIGPLEGASSITGDESGIVFLTLALSNGVQLFSTGSNCTLSSQNQPTSLQVPSNLSTFLGTLPQFAMVTDTGSVYFRNPADGLLYRIARNASGFISLTGTPLANPTTQLALDAENIYWTDGTVGTVSRIALSASGAAANVLASEQPAAAGVAVDSTAVYWTTANALMKLSK